MKTLFIALTLFMLLACKENPSSSIYTLYTIDGMWHNSHNEYSFVLETVKDSIYWYLYRDRTEELYGKLVFSLDRDGNTFYLHYVKDNWHTYKTIHLTNWNKFDCVGYEEKEDWKRNFKFSAFKN